MTKRATFTKAELTRAMKAAHEQGRVVLLTRAGIAFVDPDHIGQPIPETKDGNSCDGKFGAARSR